MENHDEILTEFIQEAREIIDRLETDFMLLEESPDNQALIGNIFRGLHTLKGSSGFFSLKRIEKLSHAGENLLGKIRDGHIKVDFTKSTHFLEMNDVFRKIIEGLEATYTEPPGDDQALVETLLSMSNGQVAVNPTASQSAAPSNTDAATNLLNSDYVTNSYETNLSNETQDADSINTAESLVANSTNSSSKELSLPVKVNPEVLDKLMNIASEMVLARNRLLPFSQQSNDKLFTGAVRNIDLLTRELQERMMKVRMQPIGSIWAKFPRLVRDVALECDKKVRLVQEGAETELDRILLDSMRDPLIHLIRNSIDHSIELPEIRHEKGKPEIGSLLLRAKHQNGMVMIDVIDDGAGIAYESIRERAITKGLITPLKAASLSNSELINLIFLPGFSTRETVTNLSGRGVGMDVVKNNIESLGGSIEMSSVPNEGTHVQLRIPLTLAILPALFIRCGDEVFLIPQNRIHELVRYSPLEPDNGVEDFYGTPAYRLRDKLIPLLFLNEQLNLIAPPLHPKKKLFIAILSFNGTFFGLVVEAVLNIQDVVIKPLGELLKDVSKFAGASIMGNGDVALILDIDSIARQSGLVGNSDLNPAQENQLLMPQNEKTIPILLFDIAGLDKVGLPLESIAYIVKVNTSHIQKIGNREVIYFNDELMDLIYLNHYISGGVANSNNLKPSYFSVLIHRYRNRLFGLIVKQVKDIIEAPDQLHQLTTPQRGLTGCVIFNDQVINMIDLEEILVMHNSQSDSDEYPHVIDLYTRN